MRALHRRHRAISPQIYGRATYAGFLYSYLFFSLTICLSIVSRIIFLPLCTVIYLIAFKQSPRRDKASINPFTLVSLIVRERADAYICIYMYVCYYAHKIYTRERIYDRGNTRARVPIASPPSLIRASQRGDNSLMLTSRRINKQRCAGCYLFSKKSLPINVWEEKSCF